MNRFPVFSLIALMALGVWLFTDFINKQEPIDASSKLDGEEWTKNKTSPHPPAPRPPSFPENITLLPVVEASRSLNSEDLTPQEDLSLVQSLLRSHRRALGGNPVGLNDEITAALTGRNVKGAATLPKDHPAISEKGDLLDRWGTPYRFHAYSEKLMEVRSAGADRKFNTSDDLKLLE